MKTQHRKRSRCSQRCCWEAFGFEWDEMEAKLFGASHFSSVNVNTDEELRTA